MQYLGDIEEGISEKCDDIKTYIDTLESGFNKQLETLSRVLDDQEIQYMEDHQATQNKINSISEKVQETRQIIGAQSQKVGTNHCVCSALPSILRFAEQKESVANVAKVIRDKLSVSPGRKKTATMLQAIADASPFNFTLFSIAASLGCSRHHALPPSGAEDEQGRDQSQQDGLAPQEGECGQGGQAGPHLPREAREEGLRRDQGGERKARQEQKQVASQGSQ